VTPATGPEVARVGPGVQGADGDDEAQPISGGDLSAAPGTGQSDVGLGVDEAGVGRGEGVGAQVVLLHPGQSGAGERGTAGLDEWFETDVAGLGDEYRADRQVQVLGPAGSFGDVSELDGEPRPVGDLQHQVGQVDARQQRSNLLAQGEQAGWFVEAVQRGEHRPVPAVDGLHSHGGVLGKSGGDRPVGGVEFAGQLGQFPVG